MGRVLTAMSAAKVKIAARLSAIAFRKRFAASVNCGANRRPTVAFSDLARVTNSSRRSFRDRIDVAAGGRGHANAEGERRF
jgi:hypothetical protein